jgi:GT2 family glycosyltransferase
VEVLVIDGRSTDGTVDKIKEFIKRTADRGQPADSEQGIANSGQRTEDRIQKIEKETSVSVALCEKKEPGSPIMSVEHKSLDSRLRGNDNLPEMRLWSGMTSINGMNGDRIRVLENPKKVVSAGLNIGFKAARGDIILRMDAHAEYGRDYIKQCLAALEKSGAVNVGGPALALPGGKGPLAQAIALAHYSSFGLGGGQFRSPDAEGYVETVWPGCFRREVFEKVGYIDERRTRTEDIDLNRRLIEAGYKIYLSPLIKAYYYCRTTLGETWRQRWADGYEITRFLPDNPNAPRLRHFIPLLFVSTILLLIIASLISLKNLTGSNIYNLSNVSNRFGLIALLLLVIDLGTYLSAMLFFVGKAALSEKRKAESEKNDQFKAGPFDLAQGKRLKFKETGKNTEGRIQKIEKEPSVSVPLRQAQCIAWCEENGKNDQFKAESLKFKEDARGQGTEPLSSNNYHLTTKSIALLPIVFLTLHFSYGLGSIWGLVTLAGWAKKRNNV